MVLMRAKPVLAVTPHVLLVKVPQPLIALPAIVIFHFLLNLIIYNFSYDIIL